MSNRERNTERSQKSDETRDDDNLPAVGRKLLCGREVLHIRVKLNTKQSQRANCVSARTTRIIYRIGTV